MGRKSSMKSQGGSRTPSARRRSSSGPTLAIVAVVAALGAFMYLRQDSGGGPAGTSAAQPPAAASKPHVQETLPALNFPAYTLQRPHDVIRAAYRFAAEHPEVLNYVPCYCGCEAGGHQGNHDCFVRERAGNGDVV